MRVGARVGFMPLGDEEENWSSLSTPWGGEWGRNEPGRPSSREERSQQDLTTPAP